MIRLRPFKPSDIDYMIKWIPDEISFSQWCAGKFTYPLTKEQLIEYYYNYEKDDKAWIMSALNENGIPVGHFLMRMADYQNESIHLGFIIIDSKVRGQGYGKEMVTLAIKYAIDILKVNKITLGVFDNNPSAHNCYQAVGFKDITYHKDIFQYHDEKWGVYDMAIEK